jgi:hypothetical protein
MTILPWLLPIGQYAVVLQPITLIFVLRLDTSHVEVCLPDLTGKGQITWFKKKKLNTVGRIYMKFLMCLEFFSR